MTSVAHHQHQSWHNHLPDWITSSPAYRELTHGARSVLQSIADRCHVDERGAGLVGAFGGKSLADVSNVSVRSLWRHVDHLEALGFIVTLGIGGYSAGRRVANCYGIPAQRGSLDTRRRARRMQRMVKGDDGRHRISVVESGEQTSIWPDSASVRSVSSESPSVSRRAPSVTACHAQACHGGTQPSPLIIPSLTEKPEAPPASPRRGGGSPSRRSRSRRSSRRSRGPRSAGGRATLRDVRLSDLTSDEALLEIHAEAKAALGFPAGDHGRLTLFAMAEHALRVGQSNPPGLFASLVRSGQALFITQADEEKARRRLNARRDREIADAWPVAEDPAGEQTAAERTGHEPEVGDGLQPAEVETSSLSDDGRQLLAAERVAAQTNCSVDRVLRADGWSLRRIATAELEIEEARNRMEAERCQRRQGVA